MTEGKYGKGMRDCCDTINKTGEPHRPGCRHYRDRKTISGVENQGEVSPMVERVARAICRATDLGSPDDWEEDRQGNRTYNWEVCIPSARAAIEAMREPAPDQLAAGMTDLAISIGLNGGIDPSALASAHSAMIDAALEEGE